MGTLYSVNKTDGVVTSGGAILPTTGGTPDILDYYEDTTHVMDFESDIFGPNAYTLTFRIIRIGKLVTLTWQTNFDSMADGTGNDNITSKATFELPARFRPVVDARARVVGHNNGGNIGISMKFDTIGGVQFGIGEYFGNQFVLGVGSQTGVSGASITYIVT